MRITNLRRALKTHKSLFLRIIQDPWARWRAKIVDMTRWKIMGQLKKMSRFNPSSPTMRQRWQPCISRTILLTRIHLWFSWKIKNLDWVGTVKSYSTIMYKILASKMSKLMHELVTTKTGRVWTTNKTQFTLNRKWVPQTSKRCLLWPMILMVCNSP